MRPFLIVIFKFIFYSGSRLRRIRLVGCQQISDEGFIEAVKNFPQLEAIHISESRLTKVSLEAIGQSCPLLKSLKYESVDFICFEPCDDFAFVIAETMSGLIHLDIKGGSLSNVGLLAILDKCTLLKSLDIRLCPFLNLSESLEKRCIDQINDLKLPDSIYNDSDTHSDNTTLVDDDDDDDYGPYWL
jgi:F-box/leucine-rich repeat protein 2/20